MPLYRFPDVTPEPPKFFFFFTGSAITTSLALESFWVLPVIINDKLLPHSSA
jgi:hypothetical protein